MPNVKHWDELPGKREKMLQPTVFQYTLLTVCFPCHLRLLAFLARENQENEVPSFLSCHVTLTSMLTPFDAVGSSSMQLLSFSWSCISFMTLYTSTSFSSFLSLVFHLFLTSSLTLLHPKGCDDKMRGTKRGDEGRKIRKVKRRWRRWSLESDDLIIRWYHLKLTVFLLWLSSQESRVCHSITVHCV